ncbi:hypothetical protein KPLM21_1140011 [Klebsiella pneumoniae]|nr:hypothetical protein KPLM21_1140011 [Klebsiella pneumoniae]CEL88835.1 hypothetical protein KVR801_790009 [Klebsiella variicola]SBN28706.1 hypothetical protein KPMX200_280006 [Klebsiella pneumoniae]
MAGRTPGFTLFNDSASEGKWTDTGAICTCFPLHKPGAALFQRKAVAGPFASLCFTVQFLQQGLSCLYPPGSYRQ